MAIFRASYIKTLSPLGRHFPPLRVKEISIVSIEPFAFGEKGKAKRLARRIYSGMLIND